MHDLIHEATEEEVRRLAKKHKIPMKEHSKKEADDTIT